MWLVCAEHIGIRLTDCLDRIFDVGALVLRRLKSVDVEHSHYRFRIFTASRRDRSGQSIVESAFRLLRRILIVLLFKVALQICDLLLKRLDVHAVKLPEALLCGVELGLIVIPLALGFSRLGFLRRDILAVLCHDLVDLILFQSKLLQKFGFH